MKAKAKYLKIMAALVPALLLILAGGSPVSALSIGEYFAISYTVEFSQAEVYLNQSFHATVIGEATCIDELPLTVSEARITGSVVARHTESGAEVVLNPEYTLTIDPFPNGVGEVVQESQMVELHFPEDSLPGSYSINGELTEAKVKALLWFNVTSYLPASQAMGVVSYMPPGEEEDEEDEIPQIPFSGKTYIDGSIDSQGIITSAFTAPSVDNRCSLTLDVGVEALNGYGQPLPYISISELEEPPPPPEDARLISLVYDIRPNGATFEPAAMLAMTYEEPRLPEGIDEEKLAIATWDETEGRWIELEGCIVDTEADTITAPVSHFSAFAAMAGTTPASFSISGLSVSPAEVYADGSVSVSAVVSNDGDLAGSYEVVLRVGGEVVETRLVTLDGGQSEAVSFTVSRQTPGLYSVAVNGVYGSFTILEEEVEALSTTQPLAARLTQPGGINGWLVLTIFAVIVILLLALLWFIKRYQRKKAAGEEPIIIYEVRSPQGKEQEQQEEDNR